MNDTLDFKMLLHLILHNFLLILTVALVFACATFGYIKLFVTPTYSSSIMLYINAMDKESGKNITINDLNSAQKLVDTYIVIIRSDKVLSKVVEVLNSQKIQGATELSPEVLSSMLSLSSVNGTEVLKVTATTNDPLLSSNIANAIADVAPDEIMRVAKAGSVEIIDEAKPNEANSDNALRNAVVAFLLGAVCAVLFVFVRNMLDNTIKSTQELQDAYDFPILGEVPGFHGGSKGRVRYGK